MDLRNLRENEKENLKEILRVNFFQKIAPEYHKNLIFIKLVTISLQVVAIRLYNGLEVIFKALKLFQKTFSRSSAEMNSQKLLQISLRVEVDTATSIFEIPETNRSRRLKSGDSGGCFTSVTPRFSRKSLTNRLTWLRALSCIKSMSLHVKGTTCREKL